VGVGDLVELMLLAVSELFGVLPERVAGRLSVPGRGRWPCRPAAVRPHAAPGSRPGGGPHRRRRWPWATHGTRRRSARRWDMDRAAHPESVGLNEQPHGAQIQRSPAPPALATVPAQRRRSPLRGRTDTTIASPSSSKTAFGSPCAPVPGPAVCPVCSCSAPCPASRFKPSESSET
jgi:hypothetical protein